MGIRPSLHLVFGSTNFKQEKETYEPFPKWNKAIKPYNHTYEEYQNYREGEEKDEIFERLLFNNTYCGRKQGTKAQKYEDVLYYNWYYGVLGLRIDSSEYASDLVYAVIGALPELKDGHEYNDGKYLIAPNTDYRYYNVFRLFESYKDAYLKGELKDETTEDPVELYPILRRWVKSDIMDIRRLLKYRRHKWLYPFFDIHQVSTWRKDLKRILSRVGIYVPDKDLQLMIVTTWS